MTIISFLLAMLLLPLGAMLAPVGIGIPIFVLGLSLILRDRGE